MRRSFGLGFGVAAVVFAAIVVLVGPSGAGLPAASGAARLEPTAGASATPGPATPTPPAPSPSAVPPVGGVPIVPVTGFRNPWDATNEVEVRSILDGTSARYRSIEVLAAGSDATLLAIGVPAGSGTPRIVLAPDSNRLRADLAEHPNRLGFLPLAEVDPSVRALGWQGVSLFGVHRLPTLDGWTLRVPGSPSSPAYDPATAWTIVAGGDVNLDGLVAFRVKDDGLGVDYPFDGGTAEITSHYCCSYLGNPLPRARRFGDAGALRALFSRADLAIANFENPAPNDFDYHRGGYTFSADPALIEGVANAGIDWVSLANNHIRDYGSSGVLDTLANLDRWGIAHGGAGPDLDAARAPSQVDVGGRRVAILAYDTIRPAYAATATRPGSNQMSVARVKADVAAVRAAGAELVVVVPHWGVEYTASATAGQRRLAHAAIDAGADVIIGNHSHWAGAMEVYRGRPIFYSLGDFVFNISRTEMTQEGFVVELTLSGSRLIQVRLRPFLILDNAQPNFLDPATSGKVVLDQVFGASRAMLDW